MREIFRKEYINNFFLLPVFAIGSFYDKRLAIGDFNFTYLFTLLYVVAFVVFLKRPTNRIIASHLFLIFVFTFIIVTINWSIWGINVDGDYSVNKLITLSCITFPVCFYVNSFKTENDILVFLKQISLIGFFLGLVGFAQIVSSGGIGESRLAVLGGGPIVFSRWVGLFFIVFLFNYSLRGYLKIPVLIVCLALMTFSGSKGPLFILILVLLILLLRNKKIWILLGLMYLLIQINLQTILGLFSQNIMLTRIFGLNESSSITSGTSSSARLSLLSESKNAILENPFGYGLGNFSIYGDKSKILGDSGYPHNFLIETWLESGIFLLLIVIAYFAVLFRDTIRTIFNKINPPSATQTTVIGIWLFYLFNSLVSGDLSDARFLIVFTALYFVLIQANNKSKQLSPI